MNPTNGEPREAQSPAADERTQASPVVYARQQWQALDDLAKLSQYCVQREEEVQQRLEARQQWAQQRDAAVRRRVTHRKERLLRRVQQRMDREPAQIEQQRADARRQADRGYKADREELKDQEERSEREMRKKLEGDIWMADSLHEMRVNTANGKHKKASVLFEKRKRDFGRLCERVELRFRRHKVESPGVAEAAAEAAASAEGAEDYDAAREQVERAIARFATKVPAMLFGGWRFVLAALPPLAAVAGAAGLVDVSAHESDGLAMIFGGAFAGGLILGLLAGWGLRVRSRNRLQRDWEHVLPALAALHAVIEADKQQADRQHEQERADSVAQRDRERQEAKDKHAPLLDQYTARRKQVSEQIESRYKQRCEAIEAEAAEQTAALNQWRDERTAAATQQYDRCIAQLEDRTARRLQAADDEAEQVYQQLRERWAEGTERIRQVIAQVEHLPEALGQPWDAGALHWRLGTSEGAVARLGRLRVEPDRLTKAEGDRYRLNLPRSFELPAVLGFARHGAMLIEHDAAGREAALATLRSVVARLLVTLPAGRARFTFVDPVGLGATFAGFMHLADYNEQLVGQRIWTEADHIQRRLAEMTEHMETVIQKYLRNEFATIDAYNEQAGELAEPFRFLVMADFPQNLDETAARRLHAIITNGARCGVYVLLACDTRHRLPQGLTMEDLRSNSATFTQDEDGGLVWEDEPFAHFPLLLDEPPSEPLLLDLVRKIGSGAGEADRVEMPFDTIAPRPEQYWQGDCTDELRVPIGRSGVSRVQELRLGKGVAQHALLAGKTGSGKSTLLHAMITNLALCFSPEQVEFYLVDFKKGVEFKTYAAHRLPHARAVAVESDREFGLSVLRRLDAELERRGELFREQGVQVLSAYRRAVPDRPMPRTLLIVDEFQELFSEDDKIAQDASLLIDRLVRQGRAFGIHVLLGSQTLAGGGGLSRSTLGQMAVRVALQCNEADSQLIFDDGNAAARLLNRPGEAIYNDASGAVEGNEPFQVAWLDEPQRERYLVEAARLAAERYPAAEPPVVFEGNAPADVRENRDLAALLQSGGGANSGGAGGGARVWLGEPITIKPASAAVLTRRSGSNLLMVGQRDDAALAISAAGLVGLAAQHAVEQATFFVFDPTPADSPHAGLLGCVADAVPHRVRVVPPRETEEAFEELNEELARRQQADDPDALPACYVFIAGLQRYRALRRKEDEFSFSLGGDDEGGSSSPDKVFAELLREGPALGMHVIAWCDTPIALDRTLDRTTLREFDWRVLFQMSATDSATLVDSPDAADLGLYRALLCSEEQGIFEKFRPYDPPDAAWVESVRQALGGTAEAEHVADAEPTNEAGG